jgi:hypothetical protein
VAAGSGARGPEKVTVLATGEGVGDGAAAHPVPGTQAGLDQDPMTTATRSRLVWLP